MDTFLIESRWGKLILLKGDMISMYTSLYGEWCEAEVRLFSLMLENNSNVIEVGAFLGTHSIAIAQMIGDGRLICFEPQRLPSQILAGNVAINSLTNVIVRQSAVSDETQTIPMTTTDFSKPWNYSAYSISLGLDAEKKFDGVVFQEMVDVVTLDTQRDTSALDSLTLLKVDAEGHEMKVLAGGSALIAKHRPFIFIENNNREQGDTLIKTIRSLGYTPYWFCSTRYQADNFNKQQIKIPGLDINMICLPDEKPSSKIRDFCEKQLWPALNFDQLSGNKMTTVNGRAILDYQ